MDAECGQAGSSERVAWGLWATVGFSCVIALVYVFIQVILVAAFAAPALIRNPDLKIDQFAKGLESNGFFLAIATCATAPFVIGLTVLFAKVRKSVTVGEYLCLRRPGWKELCKWSLAVLLFAASWDTLTFLLDRPVVPEFMVRAYTTAYLTPLLWFVLVVVAPLSEEIFFRGFLFRGIEHSRLGTVGAVVITSLAWAVLHYQYDAYGMASIFAGGLLLGFARLKSNSIYPPVVMHALQNAIATFEVVIYLRIVPNMS